ncbi:unnamed protein product [Phytophthora lilii]|uniref:Unnamed protein product n=1 Tax=Phytophthora lilii TaxID=2077276 RepID=A0A9W6XTD1_9STRA|nr:unnamed protein product [Phytophthora lilii]
MTDAPTTDAPSGTSSSSILAFCAKPADVGPDYDDGHGHGGAIHVNNGGHSVHFDNEDAPTATSSRSMLSHVTNLLTSALTLRDRRPRQPKPIAPSTSMMIDAPTTFSRSNVTLVTKLLNLPG